ncbi:TPA: glycosyltransferase family 4 protein [Stenotrophomonas maltophilia]
MTTIVFVASHLRANLGGINVLNADLLSALSRTAGLKLLCIVPSEACVDPALASTATAVTLRRMGDKFLSVDDDADLAAERLKTYGKIDAVVGHDVVTGELALAIAKKIGARSILMHHMAYGRYIALMRESENALAKEARQNSLFPEADQCFGVGPLLVDSLKDMQRTSDSMNPPKLLLPPLLPIDPAATARTAPRILYSGRIEDDNDPVKRATLAAKAIGRALRSPGARMRDASVDIYGFDPDSSQIGQFRNLINEEAGYAVPVRCLEFVDSRAKMLSAVKNASLLLMPSVHEGFGLVAWEAMCCCVPLIVTKNSGFCRFVEESGQSAHLESLSFHAHQNAADSQTQIDEFSRVIRRLIESPEEAHGRAIRLLEGIRKQGLVEATHADFLKSCGYVEVESSKESLPPISRPEHLSVVPTVQIDVGLDSKDQIEYRCNTSIHGVMNALLALRTNTSKVDVSVVSSYLDRLSEMAKDDPDQDMRVDAAIRYRSDLPKVERLRDLLDDALSTLASEDFSYPGFDSEVERAKAFIKLVARLNPNYRPGEEAVHLDAVHSDHGHDFSFRVPLDYIKEKDFYRPIFSVYEGATLLDVWFGDSSEIASAYLDSSLKRKLKRSEPLQPLGPLHEWRIGMH